ncbi:heavy metal-associated isoprenylated plant protein 3-like [Prunus avium]|uniref:Heavy metal-associated isoprenylated plant protein 3-like n=1 Tax=Prunus avium TaxID=42229 RepID=A0A6P5SLZ6_PRUAV|nr:heavy metal-associated isoprenylated plant protein 3-like [Prunus avium]
MEKEPKNNNNGVENKNKKNDGGEKKKEGGPIASKIVKWVKSFQGDESVKSEGQANKLMVVGKVHPTKLRDELAAETKNKVDLVSPQPKKDNKVNKDDANDTKKKQPEKTDNDEKPKESPLATVFKLDCLCDKCNATLVDVSAATTGCDSIVLDQKKKLMTVRGSMDVQTLAERLREKLKKPVEIVRPKKKNGGNEGNDGNNDSNDSNDGNGGGDGDEKKKEEDEGNGGGKMKYPEGQSGFGQFSSRKVYRHGYGYQNGALETGEKMLLLCCEVFGLLVIYNLLAKDIYTNVTHHLLYI